MTTEETKEFYLEGLGFTETGFKEHVKAAVAEYEYCIPKHASRTLRVVKVFRKRLMGISLRDIGEDIGISATTAGKIEKQFQDILFDHTMADEGVTAIQKDKLREFRYKG